MQNPLSCIQNVKIVKIIIIILVLTIMIMMINNITANYLLVWIVTILSRHVVLVSVWVTEVGAGWGLEVECLEFLTTILLPHTQLQIKTF